MKEKKRRGTEEERGGGDGSKWGGCLADFSHGNTLQNLIQGDIPLVLAVSSLVGCIQPVAVVLLHQVFGPAWLSRLLSRNHNGVSTLLYVH